MIPQSLFALHLFCLSFLLLMLALAGGLLLLSHIISQNSHFLVVVLVEVEPEAMAQSYLEKIVVQTLLGNAHLLRRLFQ